MEVACGEYGDVVPKLVVSVKAQICDQFQVLEKKLNCNKTSKEFCNVLQDGVIQGDCDKTLLYREECTDAHDAKEGAGPDDEKHIGCRQISKQVV